MAMTADINWYSIFNSSKTEDVEYWHPSPKPSSWSKPVSQQYFLSIYNRQAIWYYRKSQNPGSPPIIKLQLKKFSLMGHTLPWQMQFISGESTDLTFEIADGVRREESSTDSGLKRPWPIRTLKPSLIWDLPSHCLDITWLSDSIASNVVNYGYLGSKRCLAIF